MIISHKNKFIFIKPSRVAGTSVEVNLSKFCGKQDIITPITEFSKDSDEDYYNQPIQNYKGCYDHMPPNKIRKKIGEKMWNGYYKFTIVRNPWDYAVSRYWWEKSYANKSIIDLFKWLNRKRIKKYFFSLIIQRHLTGRYLDRKLTKASKKGFKPFIKALNERDTNTRFYFDSKGKPICDFYIRYENLENDYKKVCKKIGIPYEKLPRLKTKHSE